MSNWTGQCEKWQTPKMFSFKSKSSDSSHYTFSFSFTCKVRQINVWTIDNVSTLSLLFHLGMHILRTQTINCTVIEYWTLFAVEWNGGTEKERDETNRTIKFCEQKTPKCGKLLPFDTRIYRQFHTWRQWTTPMINRSMYDVWIVNGNRNGNWSRRKYHTRYEVILRFHQLNCRNHRSLSNHMNPAHFNPISHFSSPTRQLTIFACSCTRTHTTPQLITQISFSPSNVFA